VASHWINEHGGVDGHPMKIVYPDDASQPTTAVNDLVGYITSHGKPNAVFPSSGNEALALIPAAARYGVFVMSEVDGPSLLANAAKYPLEFEYGNPTYEPILAAHLAAEGYKKVGIMEQEDPYAAAETPLFVSALKQHGLDSVVKTFPADATSVEPEMDALRSAGVDVVLAEPLGAPAGYILTARAKLGWNIPIQGDLGFSANNPASLATSPSELKNVTLFTTAVSDAAAPHFPGFNTFLAYQKKYGTIKAEGVGVDSSGWDAMMIIYAAAKVANSIDPQKLASTLESNFAAPAGIPWAQGYQPYYTATDHENNPPQAILNKEYVFPAAAPFNSLGQVS
jgi:branched-chain amino acid transport system substrate-binding protein